MSLANTSNPFVGLRPFESDESLLFFGRQEQTLQLLQRLHQHHFVAVVGSSGSGKSSLIRAGLIPSLKAGYLVDDRNKWMIAVMKPGQSPLYNLSDSILNELDHGSNAFSTADLVEKIKEQGADALFDIIKPLWEKNDTNIFLLVDQFEELFRFSMDQREVEKKDEAVDFVNIILELSQQMALPVYVVITMRSDFIGDCSQFFGLPEAMNQSQYLVPKLNRVQVKNAIEGPVKLYGAHINPALTSRLLNDVISVKDELPLLQHALMRVWDHEMNEDKNGELDLNDYESIGGIEKALSNHADEALAGMNENELSLTKKMFQALTAIDENGRKIRRPVRLRELEEITGAHKDQLLPIINRFIENKRSFLMISKAGMKDDLLIDISHESLIRQWATLNGWVDEEADASKNYLRLVESSILYRDGQKNFMTGIELQLALQWYAKFKPVPVWAKRYHPEFEETKQYLTQSEIEWKRAEQKKKSDKKKRVLLIIGGIAAVIIALAINNIKQTRLKNDADFAKAEADSNRAIAVLEKNNAERNAKIADSARNKADIAAQEALSAKDAANVALATADKALMLARSSQEKTETQKEAFRLIAQARQTAIEDPTIALRIAEAALLKDPDQLIFQEAQQIYRQNSFYKTIVKEDNFIEFFVESSFAISKRGTEILTGDQFGMVSLRKKNGERILHFNGHTESIKSVAFSPDGSKILTGSEDNTARLRTINGDLLKELKGHSGDINSVAFSPDGKEILTGSEDGKAILWNLQGDFLREFKDHAAAVTSVVFSPEGTKILTGSTDGTARLWNNNSDSNYIELKQSVTEEVYSVTFSPDGTRILTGSEDGKAILWNIHGDSLREFKAHKDAVSSVAFSPDGTKILTSSWDNTAKLWLIDGTELTQFKGHTDELYSAIFSPDGTNIFTGSLDGTIRVWNIEPFQSKDFKDRANIMSIAFSPDGEKILTGCSDKVARIWIPDSSKFKELRGHSDYIMSVAFSGDGTILTGSRDGKTVLWNTKGIRQRDFTGHSGYDIESVAFSRDGTKIFTAAASSTEMIATQYNLNDSIKKEFKIPTTFISCAAFSPDGTKILTGSKGFKVILWKINGDSLLGFKGHTGSINSVTFSPDGSKILTGSVDKSAILSNLDGTQQKKLRGHTGTINSIAFSSDGTKILTGSSDKTARLWNLDGMLLWEFKGSATYIRTVAFSPDGTKIVTGARNVATLWNTPMPLDKFLQSDRLDKLTAQQKKDYGIIER